MLIKSTKSINVPRPIRINSIGLTWYHKFTVYEPSIKIVILIYIYIYILVHRDNGGLVPTVQHGRNDSLS